MTARLRALWAHFNASYWFLPALFAILALAGALLTIDLDRNGWSEWIAGMDFVVPARPDGASNMLTVIAGSMIGVAATVFSITIAAVSYASGTYGPRLLTNFLEDRGNQFSLAVFIGTFVYAITVLRTIRSEGETEVGAAEAVSDGLPGFVPQFSLLVAYALMALSVAVLVYFLNHIPSSIRINVVLQGIGKRLLAAIAYRFPHPHQGDVATVLPEGTAVTASEVGYIEIIDYAGLQAIAERCGRRIALALRTGDFVHPDVVLVRLADDGPCSAELVADIRDCFSLGASRTAAQDLEFLIDELVEIALRALSPAINDPFTAITAVHWLGAATAELGHRDVRDRSEDDPGDDRVVPLGDDFDHFVERGFGVVRSGVATNRIAAVVSLDAMVEASTTITDPARRAALRRQADLLLAQARHALKGPDLDAVVARHGETVLHLAG